MTPEPPRRPGETSTEANERQRARDLATALRQGAQALPHAPARVWQAMLTTATILEDWANGVG